MTKKKAISKIKSAQQARELQALLPSIWSDESRLSQSLLIYIAELLEKLVSKKSPRKLSPYQKHCAQILKSGGTIQEAARLWREKKNG